MPAREADQTVRILKFLASPEILKSGTNAKAVQNELGIPGILLRGILRRLTVAGIVQSRRGRTGGVTLAEKALGISVLDALDASSSGKCCTPATPGDSVDELFAKAREKFREVLANTTVAQLN